MTTPNVFVKVGTTMAKVQPARAALVKHQLEQASKVKSAKQFRAAIQRCKDKREYPAHRPGMSTAQYVKAYYSANANVLGGWVSSVRMANERATETLLDFFQPLSTTPQFAQADLTTEESI